MLSEDDKTEIQKLILREIFLVAAKVEDSQHNDESGNPSEAKRAARLLRHFADERLREVNSGDHQRFS